MLQGNLLKFAHENLIVEQIANDLMADAICYSVQIE